MWTWFLVFHYVSIRSRCQADFSSLWQWQCSKSRSSLAIVALIPRKLPVQQCFGCVSQISFLRPSSLRMKIALAVFVGGLFCQFRSIYARYIDSCALLELFDLQHRRRDARRLGCTCFFSLLRDWWDYCCEAVLWILHWFISQLRIFLQIQVLVSACFPITTEAA